MPLQIPNSASTHTSSGKIACHPFFQGSDLYLTGWGASEPRRFSTTTPLSIFLKTLLANQKLTIREACEIAGCSASVLHGWLHGAYPTDTVIHLKKLCNHFGHTLSEGLTGTPDAILNKED